MKPLFNKLSPTYWLLPAVAMCAVIVSWILIAAMCDATDEAGLGEHRHAPPSQASRETAATQAAGDICSICIVVHIARDGR